MAVPSHTRYRILFLTAWYPGKRDVQIGEFVRKHVRAASLRNDCCVLYVGNGGKQASTYEAGIETHNGFPEIRVWYRNGDPFSNAIRFLKAWRTGLQIARKEFGRPDLVHVNVHGWHGMAALLLRRFRGIPYVFTEHWTGYASGKFRKLGWFRKMITRRICAKASAVTVVSDGLQNHMEKCGMRNPVFRTVPNVVESSGVSLGETRKQEPGKKIFLTVADLNDAQKNISGTLRTVIRIREKRKDFEFHVIGGGEDEAMLRQLPGLSDEFVRFHGQVDNLSVLNFIAETDFLVVNSRVETFCVVAAESLLAGKPVIATRSGGPEYFMNEQCGILISPDDDSALEKAILHMLDHYRQYDPLVLASAVKEKFSLEKVSEKLQEVYDLLPVKWTVGISGEKAYIPQSARVLDVGSGHRPNPRANVLLDNELGETMHRSGREAQLPKGKEMVVGDALQMPFGEKEFGYIIASHIAEHLEDPVRFGQELARVGRQGYIETPGPLDEFFLNEPFHLWVVKKSGNVLLFRKKRRNKPFSPLLYRIYYLNEERFGHKPLRSRNPFLLFFSWILRRIWRYLPGTYSRYHWKTEPLIRIKEN